MDESCVDQELTEFLKVDLNFTKADVIHRIIGKRENVLSKRNYCENIRRLNKKQKILIYEMINCLVNDEGPLQIFLTGYAGTGKTETLKQIMETCNRYSKENINGFNSYIACGSTGKAAAALNGSNVHSTFRISLSRFYNDLNNESLNILRNVFAYVRLLIVD